VKLFLIPILFLISGVTVAQSNLPACQGNEMSKWNNCFGFHVKTGDHMNYGFFTNNSKYVGEYKEGLPDGKGVLTDNYNSHKYEGTFTNGKLEGQGVRYDNVGIKFEGEFVDGKPKRGTYIYKNGSKHVGEYWDGSWRGQFMHISPSGEVISQGTFVNKLFGGVTFVPSDTDAQIQKRNAEIERLRIETSSGASTKPDTKSSIILIWPSSGKILSKFDRNKKGIQISGVEGSPVVASANGRVVYAGNTLKGYGNLIILKHDNTYLTAYAHNSKLLVKDGESVIQGQKIAELGSTDSNEPKLHFEVRENGNSVDPELFLNRQVIVERPQEKNETTVSTVASPQKEKQLPQCQGNELRLWRECFGTYTYDNGSTFTGVFNFGAPSGYGTMTNPNGDKYVGQWVNGVRHGVGVQTYTDNRQTQNGVWTNGVFTGGSAYISNDGVVTLHSRPQTSGSFSDTQPSINTPQINQPPLITTQGRRLALVIGNASYKIRPLLNPRNDADDVSRVLRSTGFEVIDLRDATLAQMRTSVRQFGERLMSNDVGLVYYSGHGIEVKGRNYFIPVNADIKASDEVADQALDVSLILAKMDTAKKGVNILIVDACRDDPFGRSFRSNSRGLATMDAPQGTLIAYATAPGSVAADGTGRNSPFTKHLVRAMQVPNTPIELMFKEVRRAVREETKNQQTPWENSSLIGNFYFSVKK